MENKRTWIYCRVAHPDAHALAMQQSSLEAYAEANGFAVVGTTAEQAVSRKAGFRSIVRGWPRFPARWLMGKSTSCL